MIMINDRLPIVGNIRPGFYVGSGIIISENECLSYPTQSHQKIDLQKSLIEFKTEMRELFKKNIKEIKTSKLEKQNGN